MHTTMGTKIWPIFFLATAMATSIPDPFPKCFYGERGSLTATCVYADSSYFRMTTYRFDQLDETVQCQNCTLTTISANSFDISGNQIRNLVLNDSKIETIQTKAFIGLIFLENLVLSHNTIRSIHPGTFSGIQKVKTIDLSHNNVIILSEDGFRELVNLEQLNLASNFIETITQFAFRGLHSLKELQLEDNHIRELRDVLVNLTSLVTLNLDNNNLQILNGDEFRNLSSLAELKLSNNKLSSPVIELLPNNVLKRLDLRNNDIRELRPQFLQELRVLEHLDLSNNHIASLERNVFHSLFGLRQLDLSFNDLTLWQTGVFSVLPQLELLNCSHNDIVTVEITGVFNLNSLYALDLSHNVIRNLDYLGLVDRLPRLSYLQLEKNLLPCDLEDEIETNFQEDNFKFVVSGSNKSDCLDEPVKASVKMLDKTVALAQSTSSRVSGAEIALMVLMSVVFMCIGFLFYIQYRTYQELRWWLPLLLVWTVAAASTSGMSCNYGPRGSLTAICINATSSFFRKTPYRFDHLDETLICQNCKLLTLEESAFDIAGNFIKVLDIRNSSIIAIEPRAFLGMLHMEKLYLSHNSIKYINDWAFEGARKIKVLEMEDALSKTMDSLENNTFRELHILEVLKLKNNSLNELSAGTFEGLHNLRLLDLSHNHISWLVADVFKPLVNLRILVLNDNNLRSFQFGELRHLISLNLARNEITHCRIEIQPGNHLRSLILAGNNLSASSFQPGAFTNITNVEELDMSRNHFDRIPSKLLQGMYKLTDLDLSENRLKGIDTGAFSGLPHLRKLNLTRNSLDTLNITGRLRMDSLVQMDLSNNNIESFDYLSLLGRAPRLRYINLSNNSLSCTMEYQLRALFSQDQVMVSFNSSGKIEDCPQNVTTESAQELLYELQREFQNAYVNSTLLVWLFVLVTIAMLLLGVLFYVQFFILMGLGGRSSEGDIKSFTNIASTEISDM